MNIVIAVETSLQNLVRQRTKELKNAALLYVAATMIDRELKYRGKHNPTARIEMEKQLLKRFFEQKPNDKLSS